MKMKKILVSMFLLFFALCLKANVSNAAEISAMERLDYWDVSKEYTITNQDATYHAYLSKDKKELDFYGGFIGQKKMLDIIIPQKIENAPVVRLDMVQIYIRGRSCVATNLFGVTMFDYCDADSRPTLEILNVKFR